MEDFAAWHDLAPDHGVLELHEDLTAGRGLELHVARLEGVLLAWWLDDEGALLRVVKPGKA